MTGFTHIICIVTADFGEYSIVFGCRTICICFETNRPDDTDEIARMVNTLSHKTVFRYEAKELVPDNKELFKNIFDGIITKYNFVLHA